MATTKRSEAMRVLRIVGITLVSILILVVVAVTGLLIWARTDSGRARLRQLVLDQAHASIPGLEIGRIEGDYTRTIGLVGVTIRDSQGRPAVRIGRVQLDFGLLALLHKTIDIQELVIEGPHILGRSEPDGTLNLHHLVKPAAEKAKQETGPFAWTVELRRLRLTGGGFDLADDTGPTAAGQDLTLEASGRLDDATLRVDVQTLSAKVEKAGERYDLQGRLGAAIDPQRVEARIERLAVDGIAPHGELVVTGGAAGPRDKITIDLGIAIPPRGSVKISGWVGVPAGAPPRYAVETRLDRIDPHSLARGMKPGHLGGTITARGEGVPLQPGGHAELALSLAPSNVEGVPLNELRIDASTAETRWQLRGLTLRAPGAWLKARGQGTTKYVSVELDASLDAKGARALPLKGAIPPGMRGVGRFQLRASGPIPPSAVSVEAKGQLSRFSLNTTRIDAARLDFHATGLPETPTIRATARVDRLAAGTTHVQRIDLDADVRVQHRTPKGTIKIAARDVLVARQGSVIQAGLEAKSDGRTLKVQADGHDAKKQAMSLVGHGPVGPGKVALTLDTLRLDLKRQHLELRRPAEIRFVSERSVEIAHLAIAGKGDWFTGELGADGLYRLNRREEPQIQADVWVRNGAFADLSNMDLDLHARVSLDEFQAKLDGRVGRTHYPVHLDARAPLTTPKEGGPRLAARGPVEAHIAARQVKLEELPLPLSLARRGVKTATLDLAGEVRGDIANPTAKIELGLSHTQVRDIRDIAAGLSLDATPSGTRLSAKAQLGDKPIFSADGSTGLSLGGLLRARRESQPLPDAPIRLTAAIQSFDLRTLARLDDQFERLLGWLDARANVTGTVRAPNGKLDVTVANAQVDDVRFGPIGIHALGTAQRQQVDLRMEQSAGGTLKAHAVLDKAASPAVAGTVEARQLEIGFARIFVRQVREIGGKLDLTLAVQGTADLPQARGTLKLTDGKFGPAGQPTIGGIKVAVRIAPERVDLDDLQARSGGGSLRAKGFVLLDGLQPTQIAVDANADEFVLAANGISGSKLDGQFHVRGSMSPDKLQANLTVPDANLWMPKLDTGRTLIKTSPHEDVAYIDREGLAETRARESRNGAARKRQLDVSGKVETFFVKGKDMDLEVTGDVHVTNKEGPPTPEGTLEIRRGWIVIQKNRYDVDQATIRWNGDPDDPEPHLDIQLTHEFPEAKVTIRLHGTPKKPEVNFTSEPAMDSGQIVGLILTGQMAGAPSSGKFDPTAAISTMVIGKIADQLAPQIGVDVIRVDQRTQESETGNASGETDTRVEVGKYISERVYLSYVHVFGASEHQNTNEAQVEYRMTRRWLLQTAFGDAGVGGLDVFWIYRY